MPSHTFWVIHPMEGNTVDLRNHCFNALMQHCFFNGFESSSKVGF